MATTTPLGFRLTEGGDLVRNGDNDIAFNAQKAQDLIAADRARLAAIESAANSGLLLEDPTDPGFFVVGA